MKKQVIVAGHICLDITPVFTQRTSGDSIKLSPGRLIEAGAADIHTGGAVANTGLALKKLGAHVRLIGKIGDDAFGDIVEESFSAYGLQGELIRESNSSTSYSIVLAFPGVDRIFLHNPGANNCFTAEDIPSELLSEAGIFHFGYPPLMRSIYENNGDELVHIMRLAKEQGAATSLDLAAVDPASPAGMADWRLILQRVLPYVDFFVPSIEEVCFMLDRSRYEDWQSRAAGRDITEILSLENDIRPIADICQELGSKVLLLKCGAKGIYLRTAQEDLLNEIGTNLELDAASWSDRDIFEHSYAPDKIVSGTGAGDTCIAAFLMSVLEGYGPEMSLHLAAAEGASCVEAYDALAGLKTLAELEEKINSGWKKVSDLSSVNSK